MSSPYVRVGVSGTVGYADDASRLDASIFSAMKASLFAILKSLKLDTVELVCGGRAWAEHVAVSCFLDTIETKNKITFQEHKMKTHLEIRFPCEYNVDKYKEVLEFQDIGQVQNYQLNPGRTFRSYHLKFQRACSSLALNSFQDLARAKIEGNATFIVDSTDTCDTNIVSNLDYLIIFSFGNNIESADYHSKKMWNSCQKTTKKIHISIPFMTSDLFDMFEMDSKIYPLKLETNKSFCKPQQSLISSFFTTKSNKPRKMSTIVID